MIHLQFTFVRLLVIHLLIILITNSVFSQSTGRDVVYLKNGIIVRGTIIERIPEKSLKIQMADGSIFVYDSSEVEKIMKEDLKAPQLTDQSQSVPEGQVNLLFGVALPLGDFASTSGDKAGFASHGYCFSAQYNSFLDNSISWSISLSFAINPLNEHAVREIYEPYPPTSINFSSYKTITPMIGLGVYSTSYQRILFYCQGQIGILFGITPDYKVTWRSGSIERSASSTVFAYGLQAGAILGGNASISARYITGQTKYKFIREGGWDLFESEHPTRLLQLVAGIAF